MRSTLLVLAVVATGAWPAAVQQSGEPRGLIIGRVVDAETNRPLSAVVVSLAPATPAPGATPVAPRLTDGEGRFLFRGLAAGRYQIAVSVGGNGYSPNGFIVSGRGFPIGAYLDGGFGQKRPGGPIQPIDLKKDERVGDVVIRLWRSSAVSGRVVDEVGDPVVEQVVGIVRVSSDGRLLNGPTTRTDDRGAYRFGTLAPGAYVVFVPQMQASMPVSVGDNLAAAAPDPLTGQRFSQAGAPSPTLGGVQVGASLVATRPEQARFGGATLIAGALPVMRRGEATMAYPTTFFPSVASTAAATTIVLGPGEERAGLDVTLRPVPTTSVSGVLLDDVGPVAGFGLHLLPGDLADEASILEVAATATDARGAFSFPVVPAGTYTLVAWRTGGVPTGNTQQPVATPTRDAERSGAWATEVVAVGSRPVENLTVTIRPPVVVSGRVEFSGASERPSVERLRNGPPVTIVRARSLFRSPGPAAGSTIDMTAGGRIVVPGVGPPGHFVIGAPNLPAPWVLESIVLGGRDVTDTVFLIQQDDLDDLVLTYTDRPASVGGTVQAVSGADSEVYVVLFPADRGRWPEARLATRTLRLVRPSTSDEFLWSGVPPGDYLIAAVAGDAATDWPDVRLLERLAPVATPVRVARAQAMSVALRLVTPR